MKKTISIILTAIMLVSVLAIGTSAATAQDADVEIAYGTPVIDGTIDDVWNSAKIYKYDKYDYVAKAEVTYEPGQFRFLWDENYIYALFEINDTTLAPDEAIVSGQWYTRDGIALTNCPSEDNTNDTAADSKRSFWFIIRTNGTGPNYSTVNKAVFITEDEATYAGSNGDVPADKAMFRVSKNSSGYVIEMKLNIAAAGVSVGKTKPDDTVKTNVIAGAADFKLQAGTKFKFDTWTNDNAYTADNTAAKRDHGYTFADRTVGSYKNNSLKATAVLLAKPEVTTAEVTTAAGTPTTTNIPSTPPTGDAMTSVILISVAVLALTGTAVTVILRKGRD